MATTPEEDELTPRGEVIQRKAREVVTGQTDGNLRPLVLFILTAICMALAPVPWSIVGLATLAMLVWGVKRW